MPEDIRRILPQVGELNVSAGTNQGFAAFGEAASALSNLAQTSIEPLMADAAKQQGIDDRMKAFDEERDLAGKDNLGGKKPKRNMIGIGPIGSAYKKAYNEVDANILSQQGLHLLQEKAAEMTRPGNITSGITSAFNNQAKAIIEGVAENAQPENRAAIVNNLLASTNTLELKIGKAESQHNLAQSQAQIRASVSQSLNNLYNASMEGDKEVAKQSLEQTIQTIDNSVELGITHPGDATIQKEQARSDARVFTEVGNIIQARQQEGKTFGDALADFTLNPPEHLTPIEIEKVQRTAVNAGNIRNQAINEANSDQFATAQRQITTGEINSLEDIQEFNLLNLPQQYKLLSNLEQLQAKQMGSAQQVHQTQKRILANQSGAIENKTKSQMFNDWSRFVGESQGQQPTIEQMSLAITGDGNVPPLSGMPNTSMGTNIPEFDSILSANLTSKDPSVVARAASVYKRMADNHPNTVNLSGDALNIAVGIDQITRGGGMSQDVAAQKMINVISNRTEPEAIARGERFRSELATKNRKTGRSFIDESFKTVFGAEPGDPNLDAAFGVFKLTLQDNFISSGDAQNALESTKREMRSWGTSKYFPKGLVAGVVPEKEMPEIDVGFAVDNQVPIAIQSLIQANEQQRKDGINVPKIEWADPKNNIDVSSLTDEDKIFTRLRAITPEDLIREGQVPLVEGATSGRDTRKPRIKVDGFESEVFLVPGQDARIGQDGSLIYNLAYNDKFGNLQFLPDVSNNPFGTAQMRMQDLQTFAQSISDEKKQEQLKELLVKTRDANIKRNVAITKAEIGGLAKILSTDALAAFMTKIAETQDDDIEEQLPDVAARLRKRFGIDNKATTEDVNKVFSETEQEGEIVQATDIPEEQKAKKVIGEQ